MNSHKSKATSFIEKELKKNLISFPKIRVRYEFDINANVHCVEVVPSKVYHLDNNYIDWENDFTDKFIKSFPDQNIYFCSDDAIVGIKNHPQFEYVGNEYVEVSPISDCKSEILLEQIQILRIPDTMNIDNISSSPMEIFNSGITNEIKQSNNRVIIDSANSLTSIEEQDPALFSTDYPMAA